MSCMTFLISNPPYLVFNHTNLDHTALITIPFVFLFPFTALLRPKFGKKENEMEKILAAWRTVLEIENEADECVSIQNTQRSCSGSNHPWNISGEAEGSRETHVALYTHYRGIL